MGSLITKTDARENAVYKIDSTSTAMDGHTVLGVALVDPATGLPTGGGSAGGPSTIADGADATLGAKADAAYTSGSGSAIALLKGIFLRLVKGQATMANSVSVTIASDQVGQQNQAQALTVTQPADALLQTYLGDGKVVTIGNVSDAAWVSGSGSVIALLKTLATSIKVITTGTATSTASTVGTSSAQILAANANRKGLIITNMSANIITINLGGGTAVAGTGVVLNPQPGANQAGGVFMLNAGTIVTTAITAIASASSSAYTVVEIA